MSSHHTPTSMAVIIPVYRVIDYFGEALGSAVQQEHVSHEVLVVDDGSDAGTAEEIARICNKFPNVRLLHQPHGGPGVARNTGIANTDAELIVFLDADDVLRAGALRYLYDAVMHHPAATAVYGRSLRMDKNGMVNNVSRPEVEDMAAGPQLLAQLLSHQHPFCVGTICIRREALQAVQLDLRDIRNGEDWLLWCHLALRGNIVPAGQEVVMYRRIHDENIATPSIENALLGLKVHRTIFDDPAFIAFMGEARRRELDEYYLSVVYGYLAGQYGREGKAEEAQHYLEKMTIPVHALQAQYKNR